MEKRTLREIYEDYRPSVVCITVRTPEGDLSNGAGFHIGNGLIATARHVVDGVEIESIGGWTIRRMLFPEDPRIDLAVLETDFNLTHCMTLCTFGNDERRNRDKTDHIPIGWHFDDWVGDEFVLSRVLLMGFPRVPFSTGVGLVAVVGEVSAVVDRYDGPHPHFIISPMARGGFSGGPVISEWGFLLGVLTQSLVEGGKETEMGFASAISIEPLLDLLGANDLRPPGIDDDISALVRPRNQSDATITDGMGSTPDE